MAKKQEQASSEKNPAKAPAEKKPAPALAEKKQAAKPGPVTRFFDYVEACKNELRKITWPTARETRKATIAVLAFVSIMAVILGLIDLGLSNLVKAVLS